MKLLTFFTLLFFIAPSLADAAGTCTLGDTAVSQGKYKKALTYYALCSERGDIEATYKLASLYYYGNGLKAPNKTRARFLYAKAANKGYAPAQTMLGVMEYKAEGTETRNLIEAYKWFLLASEKPENKWYYIGPKADGDENAKKLALKFLSSAGTYLSAEDKKNAIKSAGKWKQDYMLSGAKKIFSEKEYTEFTRNYKSSAQTRNKALEDYKKAAKKYKG